MYVRKKRTAKTQWFCWAFNLSFSSFVCLFLLNSCQIWQYIQSSAKVCPFCILGYLPLKAGSDLREKRWGLGNGIFGWLPSRCICFSWFYFEFVIVCCSFWHEFITLQLCQFPMQLKIWRKSSLRSKTSSPIWAMPVSRLCCKGRHP